MLVLAGVGVAFAAALVLRGRRIGGLAELRIRMPWLVPLGFGFQYVMIELAPAVAPMSVVRAGHIASYVVIGWFVAVNWRLPGLGLIGLGGLLNFIAITANGGVMPARAAAVAAAGLTHDTTNVNSIVVAAPRLAFLGDVFAWPAPLPLANVFSVGDAVLVIGAFVALFGALGRRVEVEQVSACPAAPPYVPPVRMWWPEPRTAASAGGVTASAPGRHVAGGGLAPPARSLRDRDPAGDRAVRVAVPHGHAGVDQVRRDPPSAVGAGRGLRAVGVLLELAERQASD